MCNSEIAADAFFMRQAIKEAEKAYKKDEVPIGAIVVLDGNVVSRAHNLREGKNSAIAHAEILAIEKACKKLGSWRLNDCDLYVTLEPCPMCAGAIIQSRIKRVVFGVTDPKAGAAGSVVDLFQPGTFNHNVDVVKNILENECSQILKQFFRELREKK